MSNRRRVLQHDEIGESSTMSSVESEEGHSRGSTTPMRLQQENEALRLELQEQQEKLRLLEEQVRLAKIQDDPVRTSPRRSSGTSRRSRKPIPIRRKKSGCVGFCEDVLCYANTRTYEQIVESWYSKDELALFKGERKSLIRELKRVDFDLDKIDRSKYHLRGLEPYLSVKYNKYMQKKRAAVLQNVMLEQKTQMKEGKWDPEALRIACCEASAWARERAADLGRRDAKAIGLEVASSLVLRKREYSWGHESDHSTPSICSTVASTSTHSNHSFGNESLDSLELQSPTLISKYKVTLERVDELPTTPL